MDRGLLSGASLRNPFGQRILKQFSSQPDSPWLGMSWRQFLYWFWDFESRFDSGEVDVRTLLSSTENKWRALEDADVLMEEPRNNGAWLRPWRRALAEFKAF